MHFSAHGPYAQVSLPPYWEAIIFGVIGLFVLWAFFAFASEKPLARRWKILIVSLWLFLVAIYCVIQGNNVSYNPWTQVATGPIAASSYPPSPLWLSIAIYTAMVIFLTLLARDYQWLTWVRLWLDTFVFDKPLSGTPPEPRR